MLRIKPAIKNIVEVKGKQELGFYHRSKAILRIPFTSKRHLKYTNLKGPTDKKDEAKPDSITRLKNFFASDAKDIEAIVDNVILIPNKIKLEDLVYHYDSNYHVMRFFIRSKPTGTTLVYDKTTLENLVKLNKPVKINGHTQTLAELAKSNNPEAIVNYIAELPHSKNGKDVDLFLKIMEANDIRKALKDFEVVRSKEIKEHKTLIEYRCLEKKFDLDYSNINGKLQAKVKSTSTIISSIALAKDVYDEEKYNFGMPDKLQAILVKHCGEEAIDFLQSMLDYLSLQEQPKSKKRSRHRNQTDHTVYDPYLHFTPPDFDYINGAFRKSPHTPPKEEDHSSEEDNTSSSSAYAGQKRKAPEDTETNSEQQTKRIKKSPQLFSAQQQAAQNDQTQQGFPANPLASR